VKGTVMLVIRLDEGASFRVGDDVVVRLLAFESGRAKVGIEAPKQMPIVRDNAVEKLKMAVQIQKHLDTRKKGV
jgi:carbon storage regulator